MDITVEVMLPPKGQDFSVTRNGRYRVLMPVAIYEKKTVPTVTMPHTGYIHVTNVPNRLSIKRMNEVLCRLHTEDLFIGSEPISQVIERRKWCLSNTNLSTGLRDTLLNMRQISVTFTQFCNAMQNITENNRSLIASELD